MAAPFFQRPLVPWFVRIYLTILKEDLCLDSIGWGGRGVSKSFIVIVENEQEQDMMVEDGFDPEVKKGNASLRFQKTDKRP